MNSLITSAIFLFFGVNTQPNYLSEQSDQLQVEIQDSLQLEKWATFRSDVFLFEYPNHYTIEEVVPGYIEASYKNSRIKISSVGDYLWPPIFPDLPHPTEYLSPEEYNKIYPQDYGNKESGKISWAIFYQDEDNASKKELKQIIDSIHLVPKTASNRP